MSATSETHASTSEPLPIPVSHQSPIAKIGILVVLALGAVLLLSLADKLGLGISRKAKELFKELLGEFDWKSVPASGRINCFALVLYFIMWVVSILGNITEKIISLVDAMEGEGNAHAHAAATQTWNLLMILVFGLLSAWLTSLDKRERVKPDPLPDEERES